MSGLLKAVVLDLLQPVTYSVASSGMSAVHATGQESVSSLRICKATRTFLLRTRFGIVLNLAQFVWTLPGPSLLCHRKVEGFP